MTKREKIISFFSTYCNNKLNKNHYRKKFYTDRNSGEIYDMVFNYFDAHPILKFAPLSQKYYHIYHNTDEVSPEKFVNFVKGYRKPPDHKISMAAKRKSHLITAMKNLCLLPPQPLIPSRLCISVLGSLLRRVNYDIFLKCTDHMRSILYYTKNIIGSDHDKILAYVITKGNIDNMICPYCGKLKRFNYQPFGLLRICHSQDCKKKLVKDTQTGRIQTKEEREKRRISIIKTKKERGVSAETRRRLSESNKKFHSRSDIKQIMEKRAHDRIAKGSNKKISESMKRRILCGTFTPPRNNYYKHKRFESDITKIKTYRSGWEMEYHELHPQLSYETKRIPYEHEGVSHVYIVDFEDKENKTLIEIKPDTHLSDSKFHSKIAATVKWCEENGWQYKIVTKRRKSFTTLTPEECLSPTPKI